MMICITDWVENIVGSGENAGYQHFLHFQQCFQKASLPASLKVRIMCLTILQKQSCKISKHRISCKPSATISQILMTKAQAFE